MKIPLKYKIVFFHKNIKDIYIIFYYSWQGKYHIEEIRD